MGTIFGGPNNEDYSVLGSILGSPYSGKVPFKVLIWHASIAGLMKHSLALKFKALIPNL